MRLRLLRKAIWRKALLASMPLLSFWLSGCASGPCGTGCGGGCGTGGLFGNKPPVYCPQSNGTSVHAAIDMQRSKADLDHFVIYNHEWYMDGTELGPYGMAHLETLARRLPESVHPVMIQPSMNPPLDMRRQMEIVDMLAKNGITDAAMRVIVGHPQALDLDGNESPRIYRQELVPAQSPYYGNFNRFGAFNGFSNYGFGSGGFGFFGGTGAGLFGF